MFSNSLFYLRRCEFARRFAGAEQRILRSSRGAQRSIRRAVACERSTRIRATLRDAMRAPTRKRAISRFALRARRYVSLRLLRNVGLLHAIGGSPIRAVPSSPERNLQFVVAVANMASITC